MPTVLQFRRGTTSQNNNFTGAAGEISIDTDLDTIRVHDGSTAGGFEIVGKTTTQTLTNKTLTSPVINSGTVGTALTFNAQADVRFADSDSSNYVAFQAPATVSSNVTWTLPDADASVSGYALVSDSAGTLSWAAAGATISQDESTNTNFNLYFASSTSGALTTVKYDTGVNYNPSTGTLTSGVFSGSGASLSSLNASNLSSGTIPDARIQASGVTQHQASITGTGALNSGSITSGFGAIDIGASNFTTTGTYNGNGAPLTNLNASNLTSGTIPDARIQSSGVTQHQASLSIGASQLTGTIDDARLPSSITSDITGTAALATSVTISANNTNNETVYLTFVDGATGTQGLETDTNLTYNPSTNVLSTTATSARYADVAEKYESDSVYEPGTVISIGGEKEVTQSTTYADSAIAGVVSTNPAYLMNSDIQASISIDLALTGRVPCRVVGNISKGDVLTSSSTPGVATKLASADFIPGCILGKALEDYNSNDPGVIEVLVGKA